MILSSGSVMTLALLISVLRFQYVELCWYGNGTHLKAMDSSVVILSRLDFFIPDNVIFSYMLLSYTR